MNRAIRLTVLAFGLLLAFSAFGADFSIDEASARLEDGAIWVDATIDFAMSDEALEALDNGVPLTIVVEVEVRDEDAWFWERDLVSRELRYVVRFHPLAGLYSVADEGTGIQERFATREAAFQTLGEVRNVRVVSSESLAGGLAYEMGLRAYLDIESLPLPLRPLAYISPAWYLGTGWSRWHLRR